MTVVADPYNLDTSITTIVHRASVSLSCGAGS